MTYDEIIEQLEITKSKIKEIARSEYGGESWNDDLDALTEAVDIVADYSKATAQASEMSQKYEQPAMAVRRAAGLYTCPLCGKSFSNSNGTGEITVKPRLGHDFDENGVCTRDNYHAEAYIYSSLTKEKTYYDTAANAISKAKAPAESVHVVSYTRNDPITINKIV